MYSGIQGAGWGKVVRHRAAGGLGGPGNFSVGHRQKPIEVEKYNNLFCAQAALA